MGREGERKKVCGEKGTGAALECIYQDKQGGGRAGGSKTVNKWDGRGELSGLGSEGGWRGLQASRVLVNSKVGSERRRLGLKRSGLFSQVLGGTWVRSTQGGTRQPANVVRTQRTSPEPLVRQAERR